MSPATRGTLSLGDQIIEAARARKAVILAGPNTNDLFMASDDSFVRITELVAERHAAEGRTAVVYSSVGARQHLAPGQSMAALRLPPADTPPGRAVRQLCDALATSDRSVVLVIDYGDLIFPAATAGSAPGGDLQLFIETLAAFPVDPTLVEHRLVVIARADGLDPRLARFPGWRQISVEHPDHAHRAAVLLRMVERHATDPHAMGALESGLTPDGLARLAGGLTSDDLMRAGMEAAERGQPVTGRWAQQTKIAVLRQQAGDSLVVYPSGGGLKQVAGLPQVRLFVQERRRTGVWPRAIVLSGPPGVGKTHVVTALADELNWPAVTFGTFRSMWVGETERNLRRGLSIARAMSPLVVHLDEADQSMGQRGTGPSSDGGTSERVLAELWNFLGDSAPELEVLFCLCTNRPDLLDEATRSRSEMVPVLHPTPSEAAELLRLACLSVGRPVAVETAGSAVADSGLQLVSGRMLVRVAHRAAVLAALDGMDGLEERHLKAAFGELLERIDPINDERMALKALQLTTFTAYLPWIAAERLGWRVEHLPYVKPHLSPSGMLNAEGLNARIAELDRLAAERRSTRSA